VVRLHVGAHMQHGLVPDVGAVIKSVSFYGTIDQGDHV
jgi:hypothetical protein